MRRVENLIENKVLINTFKKLKTRSFLNKSFLRKKDFFFLKFKQTNYFFFFKFFSKGYHYLFFKKRLKTHQKYFLPNSEKNIFFFKTILMFVNLYF